MAGLMLGKAAFVPDPHDRDLKAAKYFGKFKLPEIPENFGMENIDRLQGDIPMLANDERCNCVWAGAAHEHRLWTACSQGKAAPFTDKEVLSDYAAGAGFDPADPLSDRGTLVRDAMKYRQHTGIIDALGTRHKIGAFALLEPGHRNFLDHFKLAIWLFDAVGTGLMLPDYALWQIEKGKPWRYEGRGDPAGGHYVSMAAFEDGKFYCLTYGQKQAVSIKFLAHFCDEAWTMISKEMLNSDGRTPEGFDLQQLRYDMAEIS